MKLSKGFLDFNKEILFGEIGALIGTQFFGNFFSEITNSSKVISYGVVIGSIIGASIFWIFMRFYDKRKNHYSPKKLVKDLTYFTPFAFILTSLLYYPTLFFTSKYLIESYGRVTFPIIFSQVIAFFVFLIGLNFYRYFLFKFFKKEL